MPAMLLAFVVLAVAQEPVPPLPAGRERASAVFRSSASMVALNVTVTNGQKFVTGLERDDFEVYEDGVRQEVRFFESSHVPIDLILLLDASSSMRGRMTLVHEAAKSFMKILHPGDRGAVVAFNEHVRVVQDLTADAAAIESAISATVANGATALHNAIYVALNQFGRQARSVGEVRRQAIAVLSDGEDTSSLVSFDDVVNAARKVGVNIYTISIQSRSDSPRQRSYPPRLAGSEFAMKTLAKETGAQSFFPATIHQLKSVYGAIADELGAQYSLAYSPTNTRADGLFRRIAVRVTVNPSFRPRARAGYTAAATRTAVGGLR